MITIGSPEYQKKKMEAMHKLETLQRVFPTFDVFADFILVKLFGWHLTDMQKDMCKWIAGDDTDTDSSILLQMARGEGKTTLVSIYAIYRFIHDPSWRIAIFSGGEDLSSQIGKFVNSILRSIESLEFMLPVRELGDPMGGDNFSVSGYLRGVSKDPSLTTRPIGGSYAGIRADEVIADDLERDNNAKSAARRAELKENMKALTSLMDGSKSGQRVLAIGTPQSVESVYNDLPALGYTVRIYPARIPTAEELPYYGAHLAPYVQRLYDENPHLRTGFGINGNRGRSCDLERYSEEILCEREVQQAGGMFELQYMLNTQLKDKDKYPIDLNNLMFMRLKETTGPLSVNTLRSRNNKIDPPPGFSVPRAMLHEVFPYSTEEVPYDCAVVYIDPSGGGKVSKDEIGVAAVKSLNGMVYVDKVLGLAGGYKDENLSALADLIQYYWTLGLPLTVYVEDNYGNGMFRSMLSGVLANRKVRVNLEGDYVTGQKEIRIIDTMMPLLSSNRLVFNLDVIQQDVDSCANYPAQSRNMYSLFHQMKYLTSTRGALDHDDRLDALSGALKFFAVQVSQDQQAQVDEIHKQQKIEHIRKVFRHNADTILRSLGLISTPGDGRTHKNFGAFRGKKEKIHDEKYFKTPQEKHRHEAQQAAKAATEKVRKSSSGRKVVTGRTSGYFSKR